MRRAVPFPAMKLLFKDFVCCLEIFAPLVKAFFFPACGQSLQIVDKSPLSPFNCSHRNFNAKLQNCFVCFRPVTPAPVQCSEKSKWRTDDVVVVSSLPYSAKYNGDSSDFSPCSFTLFVEGV